MIDTVASIATAVGIAFAAVGIWLTKRQMTHQFEQTFTDRYRELSDRMPIEFLRGADQFSLDEDGERAFRLYLELCEDELYFRRHGRISSSTWVDWWIGMSATVRRPALKGMVNGRSDAHELLREALQSTDDLFDPAGPVRSEVARLVWRRRLARRRAFEIERRSLGARDVIEVALAMAVAFSFHALIAIGIVESSASWLAVVIVQLLGSVFLLSPAISFVSNEIVTTGLDPAVRSRIQALIHLASLASCLLIGLTAGAYVMWVGPGLWFLTSLSRWWLGQGPIIGGLQLGRLLAGCWYRRNLEPLSDVVEPKFSFFSMLLVTTALGAALYANWFL